MTKTYYYTASSLDGFIADARHSLEWLFQFGDVEETSYPEFIKEIGAVAMGAHTYEWLLENLPPESPWPYEQPVWVFSSRALPLIPEADIRLVRGDVKSVHTDMRAAAGKNSIWIVGGGDLVGQFYDAGLLDEMIVQYAPVFLGSGKPLFPREVITPPLECTLVQRYGPFTEMRLRLPKPMQAD